MLVMAGSVSEGLVAHELAHQYAHGILANNEWKEAWLDEGMASFLDTWYPEEHGEPHVWRGYMTSLGRQEGALHTPRFRGSPPRALRGYVAEGDTLPAPMPVDRPAETFPNYAWYGYLSYSKPQAVLYMLRELVGKETMRRILHTYYDRYRFRHVNEAALRTVAEDVSGRDLGWFFDQWLRSTKTLDYRVGSASTRRTEDGGWRTTVEVIREGEAWMPVTVAVRRDDRRLAARELGGCGRTQTVELITPARPDAAVLDPDRVLLDVRPGNNRAAVAGAADDGAAGSTPR